MIDLFLVISFLDDEEDKDDGGSGGDDGDDFFLCFAKLHVSFPSFVSLFTTDDGTVHYIADRDTIDEYMWPLKALFLMFLLVDCDGQTDGRTDGQTQRNIEMRGRI